MGATMYTRMYIIHIYLYIYRERERGTHANMHIYIYTQRHIHMYTYCFLYVYISIIICIYIYMDMHMRFKEVTFRLTLAFQMKVKLLQEIRTHRVVTVQESRELAVQQLTGLSLERFQVYLLKQRERFRDDCFFCRGSMWSLFGDSDSKSAEGVVFIGSRISL